MLSSLSVVLNAVVVQLFLLYRNRFTLAIIEKSVGAFLLYFLLYWLLYFLYVHNKYHNNYRYNKDYDGIHY